MYIALLQPSIVLTFSWGEKCRPLERWTLFAPPCTFRMKHATDVGRVVSDPFFCMFEGQDLLRQEDNYIAV